ncbi:MAG: DUF2938 domain-containing protein [Roseobacter sp.]
MSGILVSGILMGVLGTVLMDLWALMLARLADIPAPNWAMVGRWFVHVWRGRVFHAAISSADEVSNERAIGWFFHYGVGIFYGVALAFLMGSAWLSSPTFGAAWLFSLLMVGFGWFLLQPGLGLGWAASKTPQPWKVRGLNLAAHTVFGFGLWLGAFI